MITTDIVINIGSPVRVYPNGKSVIGNSRCYAGLVTYCDKKDFIDAVYYVPAEVTWFHLNKLAPFDLVDCDVPCYITP